MASNWPVSVLAGPEREGLLQKLGELLRKLPIETSQMTQHYNFVNYSPSEEKVADFGEAGALNNDLEVIFCPQGRQSGLIRPVTVKQCTTISGKLKHSFQVKYVQTYISLSN